LLQRKEASSGVRNPSRNSCDGCSGRPGLEHSLPWLGGDGVGGRADRQCWWQGLGAAEAGLEQGREHAASTVVGARVGAGEGACGHHRRHHR
jgi:hypothetical protein